MAAWTSCACSVVATLPVPMALLRVSDVVHAEEMKHEAYQMGS